MTYRTLALSPVALLALTAVAVAVAPAELRPHVLQVAAFTSKLVGLVGLAAAALAFERGDYLRRGWGLWAACYAFLLASDAMLLAPASLPPLAVETARAVLTAIGNGCVVAGAWTLARAWSVAGLEYPGSTGARRAAVGLAILAAALFAGPTMIVDVRNFAMGSRTTFDQIGSDLGDLLSLPLIAPVSLTALAVRGGTLRWPWTLLASSLMAWLIYDALYTAPDSLHVGPSVRLVAEHVHVLAGAFACAAGLAQRKAVTDDDDDAAGGR